MNTPQPPTTPQPQPFALGQQIRDLLNDGLRLEIFRAWTNCYGDLIYELREVNGGGHGPDWTLHHSDILTDTHYDEIRWTVL